MILDASFEKTLLTFHPPLIAYHWVEMWTSLQGLVKFLQANAKTFQHLPEARDLVAEVSRTTMPRQRIDEMNSTAHDSASPPRRQSILSTILLLMVI